MTNLVFIHTDNEISKAISHIFMDAGFKSCHVKDYSFLDLSSTPVYYGILRGCGLQSYLCSSLNKDFWYMDNGYFDAVYMDQNKHKQITGTYRIVKNKLIDVYGGAQISQDELRPRRILYLPPTSYTAFMHNTTPGDWLQEWVRKKQSDDQVFIKDKDDSASLEEKLEWCNTIFAFNSMVAMRGIEMGKSVYTTNGILDNSHLFNQAMPYYDYECVKSFFSEKQTTLDKLGEFQWK
jgi:hypothetical protein